MLRAHLLKSAIANRKSKMNIRDEDLQLEVSPCESTTCTGFQISLKLSRSLAIGKSDVGLDLPRLPFGRVNDAGRVVIFETRAQIVC